MKLTATAVNMNNFQTLPKIDKNTRNFMTIIVFSLSCNPANDTSTKVSLVSICTRFYTTPTLLPNGKKGTYVCCRVRLQMWSNVLLFLHCNLSLAVYCPYISFFFILPFTERLQAHPCFYSGSSDVILICLCCM